MATETTNHLVLCLKGTTFGYRVLAGFLAEQTVNNQGTFTVILRDAVDFTGNSEFPDATYLAIHGPVGVELTESLPEVLLSEVETVLFCRETAHDEYARAVGL